LEILRRLGPVKKKKLLTVRRFDLSRREEIEARIHFVPPSNKTDRDSDERKTIGRLVMHNQST
jgi:hypothetical protein